MITNWNEHLKINNMIKNDIFYEMYMHRNLFQKKNLSGSNIKSEEIFQVNLCQPSIGRSYYFLLFIIRINN